MISIIAAVAANKAIGNKGGLIYWLPNDLKRFKALTMGHTIVMGRKTFESLPHGALSGRRNVVLSRGVQSLPGCDVYASLGDALASAKPGEDIYIIGGESVYGEALPIADRLYLTLVEDTPAQADAFFPEFGDEWCVCGEEWHPADERHARAYRFVDYERSPRKEG